MNKFFFVFKKSEKIMLSQILKKIYDVINLLFKFCSKVVVLYAQFYLVMLKFYCKINIKLIYYFSTNPVLFSSYIFCIMFGFFSYHPLANQHLICASWVCYILITSFEVYILSKIPYTRAFLEKTVGKEFLIKNLGDGAFAKPLITFLIGLLLIYGIEFVSIQVFNLQTELELEALIKYQESVFGAPETWSFPQKAENVKNLTNIIFSRQTGLIGNFMSYIFK